MMSKTQWGAVALGASSILVLNLSATHHQPQIAGPPVEVSPGVYRQSLTVSVTVPKWAMVTSVALFGLAGAFLYVGRMRGAP